MDPEQQVPTNTGNSMRRPTSSSALMGVRQRDVGKGGYVLVIDDDLAMQHMIADYFEGHDVPVCAISGRSELHRHFRDETPSAVILDLHLGDDDGLEVMKEIRSHSDVPIVIVTAHRQSEVDRVLGLELGADDYLTKPFSLRELLARVRAVLGARRSGARRAPAIRNAAAIASTDGSSSAAADGYSIRMGTASR